MQEKQYKEINKQLFEQLDKIENLNKYIYLDAKNKEKYEFALIDLDTAEVFAKPIKQNKLIKQEYYCYETYPQKEENMFKYFIDKVYYLKIKKDLLEEKKQQNNKDLKQDKQEKTKTKRILTPEEMRKKLSLF